MGVQLGERSSGRKHGAPRILFISTWSARAIGSISPVAVRRAFGVMCMVWSRGRLDGRGPLTRRGVNHEQEALLGRGQLGNVVLGVRPTDMLLHGAVPLLLKVVSHQHRMHVLVLYFYLEALRESVSMQFAGGDSNTAVTKVGRWVAPALTPIQRLRQLEPSWLRSGQTTSLFASVIEKDDVRDDLGGILSG